MKNDLAREASRLSNSMLRKENERLREKFNTVVNCAYENERAESRIDRMEDAIYHSHSFEGLIETIIEQGKELFNLDVVTVTLSDAIKDKFKDGYLDGHAKFNKNIKFIRFIKEKELESHSKSLKEVLLRSGLSCGNLTFFFNGLSLKIRSEAILPIYFNSQLISVIALGSSQADRFTEEHGLRFIKSYVRLVTVQFRLFIASNNQSDVKDVASDSRR